MSPPVFPHRPEVAVPAGCELGEGPVWDQRSATLLWVDINGSRVWRWRPGAGGAPSAIALPERACFVKPTPDRDVVIVGLSSGIARLSLSEGTLSGLFRPEPDRPENRLNDAGVAPDGSLLFGTMHDAEREPTGSFYRWSPSGLVRFGGHAVVTNGPCVDGPRGLVYASDTTNGRVFRHRLGPDGIPGPAEDYVTFRPGDGHPDGMAVDQEGCVWICHFGGSRITRFGPDGAPLLIVPMPTSQVTMLAFGGPDLRTAYVTTAARGRDRETDPLAGHVFTFEAGVRGLPTELCRMVP